MTLMKEYSDFVESMMLTEGETRLTENTLGLVGETGEIAEKIKKYFRDDTIDVNDLQKEFGDIAFYFFALHGYFNIDPEDTLRMNMEKLQSRKDRGVLRGSGDNR